MSDQQAGEAWATWRSMLGADPAQVLDWARRQPWAQDMADCPQDEYWHAEGDVWTHTAMVCGQLPTAPGWAELDDLSRLKLLFAALLHDSGKPATTAPDPQTGRLRAPKHAIVGAQLARKVLTELGADIVTREEIVHLVRYHSRPAFLADLPSYERPVIYTSWLLSNRLLHLLAIADTRGRTSKPSRNDDADVAGVDPRADEKLEIWKLACEEQACYDRPYAFANDLARFLFYRDELSSLYYTPHEDYRCNVTMMAGLPGAGKDTWLSLHRPELPVVSLDSVRDELGVKPTEAQGRVSHVAKDRAKEFLRERRDFAFNATNITTHTRKRWIDLFADYSARIEIVYLEPPLTETLARNAQRPSPVPAHVIRDLAEKVEPPTIAEAHALRIEGW